MPSSVGEVSNIVETRAANLPTALAHSRLERGHKSLCYRRWGARNQGSRKVGTEEMWSQVSSTTIGLASERRPEIVAPQTWEKGNISEPYWQRMALRNRDRPWPGRDGKRLAIVLILLTFYIASLSRVRTCKPPFAVPDLTDVTTQPTFHCAAADQQMVLLLLEIRLRRVSKIVANIGTRWGKACSEPSGNGCGVL